MKAVKAFVLMLLTLLLAVLLPVMAMLHISRDTVLKPYETQRYLQESGLLQNSSELLRTMVEQAIFERLTERSGGAYLRHFLAASMEQELRPIVKSVVDEVLTEQRLNEMTQVFNDRMWDFLIGETDTLRPVRVPVLEEAIWERLARLLGEDVVPEVSARIVQDLQDTLSLEVDLVQFFNWEQTQLEQLRNTYQHLEQWQYALIVLWAALAIIGLTVSLYPAVTLRWVGGVLIWGGLALLTPLVLYRMGGWLMTFITPDPALSPEAWSGLMESTGKMMSAIYREAGATIMKNALIGIGIGIVVWLAGLIPALRKNDAKLARNCKKRSGLLGTRWLLALALLATAAGYAFYVGALGWFN